MKIRNTVSIIVFIILIGLPYNSFAIPAFPGAEGFGAQSVGGRGGQIIKVTNLNNSGPGSFRAACDASGPRIVIFAVSGIIALQSSIQITNGYITIAGQTSPGGVCIAHYPVIIRCNDVIMTHMRFRKGSLAGFGDDDAANIWGAASGFPGSSCVPTRRNIIIDHCSFSWGTDETLTFTAVPQYVTLSWSIISEGLDQQGHGFGLSFSGKFNQVCQSTDNKISAHHNYVAHYKLRGPQISTPDNLAAYPMQVDYVNNVTYNWWNHDVPYIYGGSRVNFVGNYLKPGPDSDSYNEYPWFLVVDERPSQGMDNWYYVSDNHVYGEPIGAEEWRVESYGTGLNTISQGYRRLTPWPYEPITTTPMTYEYAQEILENVGATKPYRDSVDERIVADFTENPQVGGIIDNVVYPDDWPVFTNPLPPDDNDNDGMADAWELSVGFDVGTNDSNLDNDGDGYTNIEEYLHYLGANPGPQAPAGFRFKPSS